MNLLRKEVSVCLRPLFLKRTHFSSAEFSGLHEMCFNDLLKSKKRWTMKFIHFTIGSSSILIWMTCWLSCTLQNRLGSPYQWLNFHPSFGTLSLWPIDWNNIFRPENYNWRVGLKLLRILTKQTFCQCSQTDLTKSERMASRILNWRDTIERPVSKMYQFFT